MRSAQSSLQYISLIALVAVVIIATSVYLRRGFQGRLRGQANQMGEQYSTGGMSIDMTETSRVTLNSTTDGKNSTNKTSTVMTNVGRENVVRPLNQEHY